MTVAELIEFNKSIEESKKLITRQLASINVQRPELDLMLDAYEKSVRDRFNGGIQMFTYNIEPEPGEKSL